MAEIVTCQRGAENSETTSARKAYVRGFILHDTQLAQVM